MDVLDVDTRSGETNYTAITEVNLLPGFESNNGDDYSAYVDGSLSTCVPLTPPTTPAQGWYYAADVVGANDYYPFGMLMPGRKFSGGSYRYGFNGKENDNDVKGDGNQQDYGMRIYDPRVARFLSVDPLQKKYPWLTPHQFASNSPIVCTDIDGLESDPIHDIGEWLDKQWTDMTEGDNWVKAAKNVNETINPLYIGANHLSKIVRKKDIEGNPIDQRGRSGALTDLGVDVIMWGSGEKVLGLFRSENVLERQMFKGTSAMGQVEESTAQKEASHSNVETKTTTPVQEAPVKSADHHIATNKNSISKARGGPWTPRFQKFFDNAGLNINNGSENLVNVINHKGPHPEEYHQLVFDRLTTATQGLNANTAAYKSAVANTLQTIGKEAQQVGSTVNKLLTKTK